MISASVRLHGILCIFLCSVVSGVNAGSYEDFFKSVKLNDPRTVRLLLQRGFDANALSPEFSPALVIAIQHQSADVVAELLNAPAINLNLQNQHGESPLMLAALAGNLILVKQLIRQGAEVNQSGWTALHYAATFGHDEIIEFLLSQHADVNANSPNLTTALMMAARARLRSSVKLLIKAGADPSRRNLAGLSAADFARLAGDVELANWLDHEESDFRVKHRLPLTVEPDATNN